MDNFISKLNENDRKLYQKVTLISSLNQSLFPNSKYNPISTPSKLALNNEDLMNICKYSNPLIAPIPKFIQQKLDLQKFTPQKNSCLHIAAQFGNIQMVKHLVKHYKNIDSEQIQSNHQRISNLQNKKVNEKNVNGDTPLIHCLKVNSDYKMQKIVTYLSKYSDLRIRDRHGKLPFEVNLPAYSVSKVRILQNLKQKYQNFQQ